MDAHKNFALSTLASPPSGTEGTSLTVASGHGALFPSSPFNVTVWPAGVQPTADNAEIMRVTAKVSDVFTVTRAQESTSARTHATNAQIAATITAKTLTDAEYGAHGVINVMDPAFGAVGDGVTDDTAAIQAAVTAASGKTLMWPSGVFLLNAARIDVTASQQWVGAGAGLTTIRWVGAPASGASVSLDIAGAALVEVGVAPETVARGATAVTFPSDPGTLSGLLVLRDSATGSFNASRADYTAGEIVAVASQVTTTVNLVDRTFDGYTASGTFRAFTLTPIQFQMRGIRCEFATAANLGMRMRRVERWALTDCEFTGGALETVEIGEYCYRGVAKGCHATNLAAAASDQYGWAFTGAQEAILDGCYGQAARHAFATGGSAIPNRRIQVTGCQFTLTAEAQGYAAVDCHGNSEWMSFVGNQCEGALLAGDNIRFTQNQISGRGQGVGLREMLGSNFTVSDNDILTYFPNPNASRGNGVTFQSGATGAFTTRGGTLRVCGNRIVYAGSGARPAIYLVYETGFATGATTEVVADGNAITLPSAVSIGIAVNGLAASPLRRLSASRNVMTLGGIDVRHGSVMVTDDNDVAGASAQGILIRNIGTSEATQVAYARRNRISGCGFAGIAIQGDTGGNEFALVRLEDNDLPGNSVTNQGSASLEAAIVATEVLRLHIYRNTALTAGANQTYDYSLDNTVDAVQLFENGWGVGSALNTAVVIQEDDAQTYAATNVTTDRAFDADTVVVAELADVVGTLIADLRTARVVK